jgi:hypothetical protein
MGRKTRSAPHPAAHTIDAMIAEGIAVKAFCGRCQGVFKVDLELLRRAYGGEFSLVDRRGSCRADGCEGNCTFLYSTGRGPFTPLRTRDI